MADTYVHTVTQWQTDTQSDTQWWHTHRHFDCKTCWLKLSQICASLKTRCRELTSCLCCTCSVTCVHFPDNRSNSWLCGTVAITFKATCQCTNHCTSFQHLNLTILSTFVKMQNYMNIASKINIALKLHNMNIEQYYKNTNLFGMQQQWLFKVLEYINISLDKTISVWCRLCNI